MAKRAVRRGVLSVSHFVIAAWSGVQILKLVAV
jgi:hypothetical protein